MFRPKDRHGRAVYKLMRARDVTDDACMDSIDLRRSPPRQVDLAWRISNATLLLSSALIESALDDLRCTDSPPREKHDHLQGVECYGAVPITLVGAKT